MNMVANKRAPIARPNERDILSERLLDAPRDLVWEVWTNPQHVNQWWGPRGFTNSLKEMSVKPGGVWRFDMIGLGHSYPNKLTFLEVKKPERLVMSHGDDSANPDNFLVTVDFKEEGTKTRVVFSGRFATVAERDRVIKEHGALEGNQQTLDKMEELVARLLAEKTAAPFEISRVYEAPRSLVWKAMSDPKHLAQWWGPKGMEMTTVSMDFRNGGSYHYAMKSPANEMFGLFQYREIVPEAKILFTNAFADAKGNVVRAFFDANWPLEVLYEQTLTEEAKNRTRMTLRGYPIGASATERDAFTAMHPSMQGGFGSAFEILEGYLRSLQRN